MLSEKFFKKPLSFLVKNFNLIVIELKVTGKNTLFKLFNKYSSSAY
jgi:hypothetical protein